LSRTGSLDKLTINVELDPINAASHKPDDVALSLTHRVKTFIGVTVDVVLHDEGGVPRSQGKAQRVIDNR
jgi:phenylacetate-CoA ligase